MACKAGLDVLEELLVRLELGLRVVEERLAVREGLVLRCLVHLLGLERRLERLELLLLRGHQLLGRCAPPHFTSPTPRPGLGTC